MSKHPEPVCMGVALFWSAGRIDWWPAWALIAVMLAWITATATVILRFNPDLLAERMGPREGGKLWDTVIMSIVGLSGLARLIIAGLDQRYGWTGGFPFRIDLGGRRPADGRTTRGGGQRAAQAMAVVVAFRDRRRLRARGEKDEMECDLFLPLR